MKRILYSSGVVLTTERIADAVLEYAQELAKLETSDTVAVPSLDTDGTIRSATMLLGPASQLVAIDDPTESTFPVEAEEAFVGDLVKRIARLHPRAHPIGDVDLSAADPYDS